jgi:hypothetical protein
MEAGFLLDYSGAGYAYQQTWVAGEPDLSWLGGVKRLRSRARISVRTYRCSACGFLESFATDRFK